MERSAMEGISERLASVDGLYFPCAMHREAPDHAQRKSALLDLLSRDAPIFLERYGSELTSDELHEFEKLNQDYEVGWHLNRLRRGRNPTAEDDRTRSVTIKNRRRAYMERLVHDGEYFSEDAMREREPYLHHEYLGKFQDPAGRSLSRPGERWSETLMRRCEEAMLVEKIRGEQQRLGVDKREWVGGGGEEEEEEEEEEVEEEEEEEEEEEDDDDDMALEEPKVGDSSEVLNPDAHDTCASDAAGPFEQTLSAEEMHDLLEQFTHVMQQKFLAGEDTAYIDYSRIDNDERLDDHWLREANYDAEEKYFEED
ncbi:unnamed protein product [Musa textilis]